MALTPKERERIIEEESLRFQTRRDLNAQACAQHPRRGRWLWVVALLLLAVFLFHHARCGRGCWAGMGCQRGMGMGMMGEGCHHPWMMPPAEDGTDVPPPAPDADDKAPAPAKPASPAKPSAKP